MKLICISTAVYGHSAPLLSIAKAWQARGGQVIWVPTWGRINSMRDLLSAERIPMREVKSFCRGRIAPDLVKLDREKRKQLLRTWMMPGFPSYRKVKMWWRITRMSIPDSELFREQVEGIAKIIEMERPDAILTESFSIQGVTAAQVSGVPFACQHVMFTTTGAPMPLKAWLAFKVMQLMMRGINRVRCQLGLSESSTPYMSSNRLNVVGSIPSYMRGFMPTDKSWQCVGPLIGVCSPSGFAQEESVECLDDWLAKLGRPPFVYLSLGTTIIDQSFFDLAIDAFAQADLAVLMTLGPQHINRPTNSTPPNIRLVRWFPQRRALARASVAVIHGGQGTCMGCVAAGVPAVVVPFAWDQGYHAGRFVTLGNGIRLNRKGLMSQQLLAAVERLLTEPLFKTRAEDLSDEMAQYDGPKRACDLIEERLIG